MKAWISESTGQVNQSQPFWFNSLAGLGWLGQTQTWAMDMTAGVGSKQQTQTHGCGVGKRVQQKPVVPVVGKGQRRGARDRWGGSWVRWSTKSGQQLAR